MNETATLSRRQALALRTLLLRGYGNLETGNARLAEAGFADYAVSEAK
jgi:hypothetical protein